MASTTRPRALATTGRVSVVELALDLVLIAAGLAVGFALLLAVLQRRSRVGPFSVQVLLVAAVVITVLWVTVGYE